MGEPKTTDRDSEQGGQPPAEDQPLNGLSVNTVSISQDGEVEVEFELPHEQTTPRFTTSVQGSRSFDVYEDDELREACRRVFDIVRSRVQKPDPEREQVHCDSCDGAPCCHKYNILLRDEDIERLARGLGTTREDVVRRYTVPATDWTGDFERQLASEREDDDEEACVFLRYDELGRGRCGIYGFRPQICRDFDMKSCTDFVALEDIETVN